MTYEEGIKYAKEIHFCTGCPIDMSIEGSEKHCDECEHRAFFELAIKTFEKQIPKKPIFKSWACPDDGDYSNPVYISRFECPVCNKLIAVGELDMKDLEEEGISHCSFCGKKLLWEEDEG